MAIPWIKKYEPKSTSEIVGQDEAVEKLKRFVQNFKKGQKGSACILYGATGTGKTASVHALANELSYEIIEVNASDFRNKEQIDSVIGNATKQMSLFAMSKIILVDEIDGLSGTKDRGGISEIATLISETNFPMILTANDIFDQKFSDLRKNCDMIEFKELDQKSVLSALKRICDSEGIKYEEDTLKSFARRVGTDLRAAINDLQTLTTDMRLTKESLEELSERNKSEAIQNALLKIFKTTDANIALSSLENVDEDYDKCILWIDENLPKEYKKPEDLARAYDKISRADVFGSRIKRRQHWRFLVYVNALLSAGVATAKDEKYKEFIKYEPTKRILKLWQANMKFQKRKNISEKIALVTHSSRSETIRDSFPFIKIIFENDKKLGGLIAEELELDKDEIAWMNKAL